GSEIASFIPLSKGIETLLCPLCPCECTFTGVNTSNGSLPLPMYLMCKDLDVGVSFWVSVMRIMIDRQYPKAMNRSSNPEPVTRTEKTTTTNSGPEVDYDSDG